MAISVGDRLPEADFLVMGPNGAETVPLGPKLKGRKVVLFGLPGAYTGTCSTMHVPSFVRNMAKLAEKGVEEVINVSVNDPFVMTAWAKTTGAAEAGITSLADPAATFTKAIGMEFSVPPLGFHDRSRRYSMLVVDGVVEILNEEPARGECEVSAAETLLDQM